MTAEERNFCLTEMSAYSDAGAYASDLAISSVWGDTDASDIPADRIDELRRLWDAIHLPMRELLAPLSIAEASRRFCIPYRTVQDWFAGLHACPAYLRLLLAESLQKL